MWLKFDFLEVRDSRRDLCGYEFRKYGVYWGFARGQKP